MDPAPGGMGRIPHRVYRRRLKGEAPDSANQAVCEPGCRQAQIDNGPLPAYLDGETPRRLTCWTEASARKSARQSLRLKLYRVCAILR